MINHPAKLTYQEGCDVAFQHKGFKDCKHCQRYTNDAQFTKLVKWLEEHNMEGIPGLDFGGPLHLGSSDWQSLRQAAGLEEQDD